MEKQSINKNEWKQSEIKCKTIEGQTKGDYLEQQQQVLL
jgi:hypothetical protein